MIASVRGEVLAVAPDAAVIEVGGVGMAVQCSPNTLAGLRLGEQARLATSLVVREDSLTLFGFADADEREVFEVLQTVTGVGPKLALAVLAVHSPEELRVAVAAEDLTALKRVPGIGHKGAQRMVLELKDKAGLPGAPVVAAAAQAPGWRDTLSQALVGLGWTAAQSDQVVDGLALSHPDASDEDVPVLLRAALSQLGRRP